MGIGGRYRRVTQPRRTSETPPPPTPESTIHVGSLTLGVSQEDDPHFVRLVGSILESTLQAQRPDLAFLIQIDGWFDAKWLEFSGKILGTLGAWQDELTLPPFHPHRVVGQTALRRTGDGLFERYEAPPLHLYQPSKENINRKIKHAFDSAAFAWWSHCPAAADRASLMVYSRDAGHESAWYASFQKKSRGEDGAWQVGRTKNITPVEIRSMIEAPA